MWRCLPILLLITFGNVSRATDFAVAPFIEAIPGGVYNDYTLALRVYALPDFELIASHSKIVGLTTVSVDGRRLYEVDSTSRRVRTFELPSLRLLTDVPLVTPAYFENWHWLREHPRRPGVLLLRGVFWIDARTGAVIETPESLGIPAGSYNDLNATLSQAQRKLLVFDFFPFNPAAPYLKIIDLDDPRNVQTISPNYAGTQLMEAHGLVGSDGINERSIVVRDLVTLQPLHTLSLPAGMRDPFGFTPSSAHELLLSAVSDDYDEQILLRFDLQELKLTELYRQHIDIQQPGFATIEVRGNVILLSAPSEPGLGVPVSEPLIGQLRYVDATTGATGSLQWPHGGGPYTNGQMLAIGTTHAVPIDPWTMWLIAAFVLLSGLTMRRSHRRV